MHKKIYDEKFQKTVINLVSKEIVATPRIDFSAVSNLTTLMSQRKLFNEKKLACIEDNVLTNGVESQIIEYCVKKSADQAKAIYNIKSLPAYHNPL